MLMPSTFCPMENGDSLVMGQDRNENIKEIARHSKADADAYDQYSHDIDDGDPCRQAAVRQGAAEPVRPRRPTDSPSSPTSPSTCAASSPTCCTTSSAC